jgi:hypothetical protein
VLQVHHLHFGVINVCHDQSLAVLCTND